MISLIKKLRFCKRYTVHLTSVTGIAKMDWVLLNHKMVSSSMVVLNVVRIIMKMYGCMCKFRIGNIVHGGGSY